MNKTIAGIATVCLLLAVLLGGCAAMGRGSVEVRGLVFHNAGTGAVERVSIRVPRTGAVANCGFIPAEGECSTTFPVRRYQGQPVEVAWASGGRQWSSGPVVLRPLSGEFKDVPQHVQVWLDDFGAVEILLVE